jgi:hypothetical protein
MIYTAPYVPGNGFDAADPLLGQVGGGWALEIETFLGTVEWHRAVRRRVPFGAKKSHRTAPYPPITPPTSLYLPEQRPVQLFKS